MTSFISSSTLCVHVNLCQFINEMEAISFIKLNNYQTILNMLKLFYQLIHLIWYSQTNKKNNMLLRQFADKKKNYILLFYADFISSNISSPQQSHLIFSNSCKFSIKNKNAIILYISTPKEAQYHFAGYISLISADRMKLAK